MTLPPDDTDLQAQARVLAEKLQARGLMLATAESCTGGWIAKVLTDLPGSSAWFAGGAVSYSNPAKRTLLGVRAQTLQEHGAVSAECALEMAAGACRALASDLAVAVTGIAGPAGGSADKPVGTVWIAWSGPGGIETRADRFRFDGDREAVRRRSVAAALAGLIARLG